MFAGIKVSKTEESSSKLDSKRDNKKGILVVCLALYKHGVDFYLEKKKGKEKEEKKFKDAIYSDESISSDDLLPPKVGLFNYFRNTQKVREMNSMWTRCAIRL